MACDGLLHPFFSWLFQTTFKRVLSGSLSTVHTYLP